MQDYIQLSDKNGITLLDKGRCLFCGADTERGFHKYTPQKHIYRFLIVDAHTLQHSEIHVRWNDHFHLLRLHLIFMYGIEWTYELSHLLSSHFNKYKMDSKDEYLDPPVVFDRRKINGTDIMKVSATINECKTLIRKWAVEVYTNWEKYHLRIGKITKGFQKSQQEIL